MHFNGIFKISGKICGLDHFTSQSFIIDNMQMLQKTFLYLLLWYGISCLLALPELKYGPQQRRLMNEGLPCNERGNDIFLKLDQLESRLPS